MKTFLDVFPYFRHLMRLSVRKKLKKRKEHFLKSRNSHSSEVLDRWLLEFFGNHCELLKGGPWEQRASPEIRDVAWRD